MTIYITQDEHDLMLDEASMAASESGASSEYGFDIYDYEYQFVSNYLGTDDWDIKD